MSSDQNRPDRDNTGRNEKPAQSQAGDKIQAERNPSGQPGAQRGTTGAKSMNAKPDHDKHGPGCGCGDTSKSTDRSPSTGAAPGSPQRK